MTSDDGRDRSEATIAADRRMRAAEAAVISVAIKWGQTRRWLPAELQEKVDVLLDLRREAGKEKR